MPTLESIQNLQTELIRKSNGGSVFIAESTADLIETLTTVTGTAPNQVISLTALPSGYEDLGYTTDDGAAFSTDTTSSDVTSWQSTTPTRSDITAETSTLTVACQETKLLTIGLYTGATLASLVPDVDSGELQVLKPERPSSRFYRVLSLMVDGQGDDEIWMARFLPRAKVTGKAEQAYSKGDSAVTWGVTFTGFKDTEYGSAESFLFGGPGWKKLVAAMS